MIEEVIKYNKKLALIIRSNYSNDGIVFFNDEKDSQQLGYMKRPQNYIIPPHRHNLIERQVHLTQEVLVIKSGKIRVDIYDNDQTYLLSKILLTGDVIILLDGGHGFKILEHSEIIEIKQGPYCGNLDKIRFDPIDDNLVLIK